LPQASSELVPPAVSAGAAQHLVIPDWHPTMSANGSHGHWATRQKKHDVDMMMAWASAKHAGWTFMSGRVKLTITLVYPRTYRVDADNLAARCKGLIDGLKGPNSKKMLNSGFFTDDNTQWLELTVRAEVRKGCKQTEITLESLA
jgi:hypothetical protein